MAAKSSKKRSTSPKHQQRLSRQGSHTALDVVMFIHLINNKRNTVMQIRQLMMLGIAAIWSLSASAVEITGKYVIPEMPEWARNAVFYQIYPQTFCDSDGDGIGDLKGIISKLDYVKSLGVDAIWFNPFFDSPFNDAGYDIRDYYKIAPRYGTNDDARRLFEEGRNGTQYL